MPLNERRTTGRIHAVRAWLTFHFERWALRGAMARLWLIGLLLALIVWIGGTLAFLLPRSELGSYRSALWWALLRVSDPGYLGDEPPSVAVRVLSLSLSILGMGILVGGVVAVVTNSLGAVLGQLARGQTPVAFHGHCVVLGWTDRTPRLIQRFVQTTQQRLVVLVEDISDELLGEFEHVVPTGKQRDRIVFRSGRAGHAHELMRTGCQHAQSVIYPAPTPSPMGSLAYGPIVLKTLFALRTCLRDVAPAQRPLIVVELIDTSIAKIAQATLPDVCLVPSDRLLSRVLGAALQAREALELAIACAAAKPDLNLNVRTLPALAGVQLGEAERRVTGTRPIGVIDTEEDGRLRLDASAQRVLRADDALLVFSRRSQRLEEHTAPFAIPPLQLQQPAGPSRVLMLGWNNTAPALLFDLSHDTGSRYEVHALAPIETAIRQAQMARLGELGPALELRHSLGDPSTARDLLQIDVMDYDRCVVFADRECGNAETADVKTLAAALALSQGSPRPDAYMIAELLDPTSAELVGQLGHVDTPHVVADLLAAVAHEPQVHAFARLSLGTVAAYALRVVSVAPAQAADECQLASGLRAHGLALMSVLEDPPDALRRRVLVIEPRNWEP